MEAERWFVQTLRDLDRHEGFREYAYPDPISPIGKAYSARKHRWGLRPASIILKELGLNEAQGRPWTIGHGFTKGVKVDDHITLEESYKRLSKELIAHVVVLDKLVPEWKIYPMFAKTVLANLAFNLGGDRLSKFYGTLSSFNDRDWQGAARGLRNSLWYKQVGVRGEELVDRLVHERIHPRHIIADFSGVTVSVSSTAQLLPKER